MISGGFNVYPIEVETELLRVPGIRAAAVVGQPDPARGEIPVAFVETDDGFDAEAALATLRERLASFKVPKHLYPIDALPRNAMGKVEKPRLRELLARSAARVSALRASASESRRSGDTGQPLPVSTRRAVRRRSASRVVLLVDVRAGVVAHLRDAATNEITPHTAMYTAIA